MEFWLAIAACFAVWGFLIYFLGNTGGSSGAPIWMILIPIVCVVLLLALD